MRRRQWLNTSPAFLYEQMKDLGDTAAHIEEKRHSEAQVYYLDQRHLRHVYAHFFRTREACKAAAQTARNKADEEARKLDKCP
jgi:hypothetical protein